MKSHLHTVWPVDLAGVGVKSLALIVLVGVGSMRTVLASDPVGVFAVIDKVVLSPRAGAPERIQLWGTFSLAHNGGNKYRPPETGYLYYKLPATKADVARIEWKDLKQVAGKKEVIGFGSRRNRDGNYADNGRVRKIGTPPSRPDEYIVGWGLVRMKERRTHYAPIRDTLAQHKAKGKNAGSRRDKEH